jgi:hypothetical protein
MSQIYQCASRVVAWIGRPERVSIEDGDEFADIESAIHFVNKLFGESESTRYYNRSTWHYPNDYPQLYKNQLSHWRLTSSDPSWASLLPICQRRFWSGLWIIQKLILARDIIIQCGRFLLS